MMPQAYGLWTSEDVDQDAEILRLKGKVPSRAIISKKYERFYSAPRYVALVRMSFEGVASQADELVNWASEQGLIAQEIIQWFLDDPEARLPEALEQLGLSGVSPKPLKLKPRKTYASMLVEALPATKSELLDLLSREAIQRPDATLRAWLRRHKDKLLEDDQGRYYLPS